MERDWEVGGQDNMHGEKLKMGFFNCRGWHSREVDIMLLRKLDLDMWLAETFLQGRGCCWGICSN